MDYEKISIDVLRIVRKYKIELDIIKRNIKIRNEMEERYINTIIETDEEVITSRFDMKRKKSVCYRYKRYGLYDIESGLYIQILYKHKTSEIIYIYKKDLQKIEIVNLI